LAALAQSPHEAAHPVRLNIKKETIMIIGNFKYDAKADTYTGEVTTLTFHRSNVQIRRVEKTVDKEPDYRVVAQTSLGTVEFGAAWKRTSERGQDFLSVAIEDPSLAGALNAALFRAESGDTAALVWNRPKRKKAA
jgi:uncharacterized protein (DUF736 family)